MRAASPPACRRSCARRPARSTAGRCTGAVRRRTGSTHCTPLRGARAPPPPAVQQESVASGPQCAVRQQGRSSSWYPLPCRCSALEHALPPGHLQRWQRAAPSPLTVTRAGCGVGSSPNSCSARARASRRLYSVPASWGPRNKGRSQERVSRPPEDPACAHPLQTQASSGHDMRPHVPTVNIPAPACPVPTFWKAASSSRPAGRGVPGAPGPLALRRSDSPRPSSAKASTWGAGRAAPGRVT